MRRFAGAGLLLFFVFVMAGIYPAQWTLRCMARREMKTMMRARGGRLEGVAELSFKLVRGEVADAHFTWEEEDEFSFNDRLYDVIDSKVAGDIITFRCLPDGREDVMAHCSKELSPFGAGDRSPTDGAPLMLKLVMDQFTGPVNEPARPTEAGIFAFKEDPAPLLLAGFERVQLRPPAA